MTFLNYSSCYQRTPDTEENTRQNRYCLLSVDGSCLGIKMFFRIIGLFLGSISMNCQQGAVENKRHSYYIPAASGSFLRNVRLINQRILSSAISCSQNQNLSWYIVLPFYGSKDFSSSKTCTLKRQLI